MKLIPRLDQTEILRCVLTTAKKMVQDWDVFETKLVLFLYATEIGS